MKGPGTRLLIVILTVIAALFAYLYFKNAGTYQEPPQSGVLAENTPAPIPIIELTPRQKVAQLLAVPLLLPDDLPARDNPVEPEQSEATPAGNTNPEPTLSRWQWLVAQQPGIIIYYGQSISQQEASAAQQALRSNFQQAPYQPLLAVDHEGGSVQRLSGTGFSQLDSWQQLVNTYTSANQRAAWADSASQLAEVGINIVFAPVVDLEEQEAVLRSRAASDSALVESAAANFVAVFGQYQIMPVLKHFPGIGSLQSDLHNQSASLTLKAEDTAIFSHLLEQYPNIGLMVTHVSLANKFNGQICSLSSDCLSAISSNFPQVLIFTDDLMMASAREQAGSNQPAELGELAVQAVRAGNDVLVFGPSAGAADLEQVLTALETAYNDSQSFRERVDGSVAKILLLKKQPQN